MVVKIGGRRMYLWRAVDDEGVVLDMLVQHRRNTAAALKLLRRLLKNQGLKPESIVTDGLRSYGAALSELGLADRHRPGRQRENNRIERAHLPLRRRERARSASNRTAPPSASSPPRPPSITPTTTSVT